ncbi:hypothetical protein DBV15_03742 [Temnothorax longispinosus]|uniref:Uncharacterized protein n=1 Tax=Temnothorax longispinosus TaxID=300112 RepID=A0A4S2KQV0_9HYME|nr:hypothetical protein DBV15_03742 [Temnothorax longispinosus]
MGGAVFRGTPANARKFFGEAVARVANFLAKNCCPAKLAGDRKKEIEQKGKKTAEETAEKRNENPPRGASNVCETRFARAGTTQGDSRPKHEGAARKSPIYFFTTRDQGIFKSTEISCSEMGVFRKLDSRTGKRFFPMSLS